MKNKTLNFFHNFRLSPALSRLAIIIFVRNDREKLPCQAEKLKLIPRLNRKRSPERNNETYIIFVLPFAIKAPKYALIDDLKAV